MQKDNECNYQSHRDSNYILLCQTEDQLYPCINERMELGRKFTDDLRTNLMNIPEIIFVTNSQNSYADLMTNLRTKSYDHLLAVIRL